MVFDKLFGKGPLSEKKIEKLGKLAANPFAQPDIRMRELQRLLADGSTAAIQAALKRFAANANSPIADEEEKQWLEDAMVDMGDLALEPLRRYIRGENKLTYALRAFQRSAGNDEAVRFFLEVMRDYGPEDHRSDEAKTQLIWVLKERMEDERVLPGLVDFLEDHSDDVRWAVMDVVEQAADDGTLKEETRARACELLLPLVQEDQGRPRIQQRAADILVRREWKVPEGSDTLCGELDELFFIDKKRFVRRRAKARG